MTTDQVRAFVSIDLDDPQILAKIDGVMSTLSSIGGDLKPVERQNIHLTLKFLGILEPEKLSEVRSALARVQFQPINLEINGAGAFPNLKRMNVIWIGVGEGWSKVEQIFEQTEKFLHEIGFSRENRPFSPHITIARVRSGRRTDEIAVFLERIKDESFGSFNANSVRLKQSKLSPSGPSYSTLFEVKGRQ